VRLVLATAVLVAFVPAAAAKLPPLPTEAAMVPTGRAPCGLAAHDGRLWIGVYEAGAVLRLAGTGRVRQRIRVGPWACRVAADERALWVTRDRADAVVRIDLRTGRMRTFDVSSPFDLAVAAGAVWVTSFDTGTVTRLDRATGRRTRAFRIGGNPAGISRCGGRLWVGHGRDATWLTAIDPATGVSRRVDVGVRTPGWPRCARGELVVTTADSLLRIAPRTGVVRARIRIGGTPAEAAAVRSAREGVWSLWVTDKERSLVHRVDPTVNRVVDSFPAGPGAFALAELGGSMWITSFAGSDVRRYDP
jgi:streptogramin lyase